MNVPEGSYSTDPYDGRVRIREFKQMVNALHRAGIGVVMDVVYNHTFESGNSWFHRTVPYYYHRVAPDGKFADGSACGNEIASERCMCRRYIVDSVLYWASEYYIDGFRFDLMGLLDVETMNEIRRRLDGLPEGKKILMYGEPWSASAPSLPVGCLPADKRHVRLLDPRIGAFSDGTRDAIRGDVFIRHKKGFVQGEVKLSDTVRASLQGWTQNTFGKPFAIAPTQVVSYVSVHDNLTLWDKLVASTKRGRAYAEYDGGIVAINRLCAVLCLMAQGMPLFQAGEEFARTKRGMDNSFRASSSRNRLDWGRAAIFSDLVGYYRGLLRIRRAFPALRDFSAASAGKMSFSDSPPGTVAFTLDDGAKTLAVCVNAFAEPADIGLNSARSAVWEVLADGSRVGTEPLRILFGGMIRVAPKSAVILRLKNRDSAPPRKDTAKAGPLQSSK